MVAGCRSWAELGPEAVEPGLPVANRMGWFSGYFPMANYCPHDINICPWPTIVQMTPASCRADAAHTSLTDRRAQRSRTWRPWAWRTLEATPTSSTDRLSLSLEQ